MVLTPLELHQVWHMSAVAEACFSGLNASSHSDCILLSGQEEPTPSLTVKAVSCMGPKSSFQRI